MTESNPEIITSDVSAPEFLRNKILNPFKGAFYRQFGAKFSRVKKAYGLLRFYQVLVAIDDYLLDKVERALRGEKVVFNLAPDYLASYKYMIQLFEYWEWKIQANQLTSMHNDIFNEVKYIDNYIKTELDAFFKSYKPGSSSSASLSDINVIWHHIVKTPKFKDVINTVGEMLKLICQTANLPFNTDEKMNNLTKIRYIQFSIVSKPQMTTFEASEDVTKQIEFNKKLVQVKEAQIKKEFANEGLKVSRLRFGPYMLMIGSDPSETETLVDSNTGEAKVQPKMKKIYCDQMADKGAFESMKEFQEAATEYNTKYNALRSLVHNPKIVYSTGPIEEIDPKTGEMRVIERYQQEFKDIKGRKRGKFLNTEIQYTQIEAKPGIRGQGNKTNTIIHTVSRLDEEALTHVYGDLKTREITDVDRDNKFTKYSLKRNVETQMIKDSIGRERIIIVSGRYRGYFLDDMVNIEGRMIEGSSYTFNLKGRINKYETLRNGQLALENLEEPYITLSLDKACKSDDIAVKMANCHFYLGIPYLTGRESNKFVAERRAMRTLSAKQSDVQEIPESKGAFWTFTASSYEAVRSALGSCALSYSASQLLVDYYQDLLKKEYALHPSNVKQYTPERIGGFKATFGNKGQTFKLNNKQMEALAWLDANNFSGLMALDTGVGKTLLATAAILLAKKKESEEGSKQIRRFLFVEPAALVGNLKEQAVKIFCENPDEVIARIDEISYDTFLNVWKEGKKEKELGWTPAKGNAQLTSKYGENDYYAVFFDEINYATTGDKARAVSGLKHTRKILLTGSAIEKDPVDLFKFVGLTKGIDVTSKAEQNKFVGRYANVVGGRFVGIKPGVKTEFDTWVRTNAYFADKQEVNYTDVGQPALKRPKTYSTDITMPVALEKVYSSKASTVSTYMKQMLKIYSQNIEERSSVNDEKKKLLKDLAKGGVAKEIKFLHDLSTNPQKALARLSDNEIKAILYPKDSNGKPVKPKTEKEKLLIDALVNKELKELRTQDNPKISQAVSLAEEKQKEQNILYFTDDSAVAYKNAISISDKVPNLHLLCLPTKISVFKGGKEIHTFNKQSDTSALGEGLLNNLNKLAAPAQNQNQGPTPEELEEQTKWAQVLFKQLFKPYSSYFKTMTCTGAYARGFNFQEWTCVVHLDRNGWSSEEMKQRTARSYRQGQENEVEEIFIDMVYKNKEALDVELATNMINVGKENDLPSAWKRLVFTSKIDSTSGVETLTLKETISKYRNSQQLSNYLEGLKLHSKTEEGVSIDELRGLVQGKDQEFFNSIIKDAMNMKLLESYESVQRDTSKSVGTSARLLMRAINPTSAEVASLNKLDADAQIAPLYHDTPFDDKRFDKVNLKNIKTSISSSDVLDLSGFGELFNVANKHTSKAVSLPNIKESLLSKEIQVSQMGGNTLLENSSIVIKHDGLKATEINVQNLTFKKCAPPELFASTILSMIKSAVANGVSTIKVNAKAEEVSTYVKLGFDGHIPIPFITSLQTKVKGTSIEADVNQLFGELVKQAGGNKAEALKLGMFTLFSKQTASKFNGAQAFKLAPVPMTLTLDLSNNRTTEPIMLFFKAKAVQAGINPSEFFTKKEIAPFNLTNSNCWTGFLTGAFDSHIDTPKEAVIKKYLKDLKKVMVSNPSDAQKLVNLVSAVAPALKPQLLTILKALSSSSDIETKVQFIEDKLEKKALSSKKASAISDLDDDPILNNVWETILEVEEAKNIEADIAFELGDFLSAEILKP